MRQALTPGAVLDFVPWRRSKLMIVGRGEAGKSATLASLLGKAFQEDRESTVGAATSEYASEYASEDTSESSFSVNKRDVQAWTVVDETKESKSFARSLLYLRQQQHHQHHQQSPEESDGDRAARARKHHADLKQRLGSPGRRKRKGRRNAAQKRPPASAPISPPESRNKSSRRDPGIKTSESSSAVPQEERKQLGTIANSGDQGGQAIQAIQAAHAVPDAEVARLVSEAVQLDSSDSSESRGGSADSDAIIFSAWDFGGQRIPLIAPCLSLPLRVLLGGVPHDPDARQSVGMRALRAQLASVHFTPREGSAHGDRGDVQGYHALPS